MLERELQNFGLGEKEAKVYLAALELGTATVQELSKKSGVNRATTYIQVESLIQRGLISSTDRQKKSLFIAEKPQRLIDILTDKKIKVDELENKFNGLMPDFEAIYNVHADRPRVRFLAGEVGLNFWRNEVYKSKPKELYLILPKEVTEVKDWKEDLVFNKIIKSVETIKMLYLTEKNFANKFTPFRNVLTRIFFMKNYELDLAMFNNKIFLNKPIASNASMGVLIEDKLFYKSFVAIIELLWQMAQPLGVGIDSVAGERQSLK